MPKKTGVPKKEEVEGSPSSNKKVQLQLIKCPVCNKQLETTEYMMSFHVADCLDPPSKRKRSPPPREKRVKAKKK